LHVVQDDIMTSYKTGSADRAKGPWAYYALIAAVLFQGLSAFGGGIALVAAPSGALLGIPLSVLAGSPFGSYLLPGLVLLTALGILPLLVSWGLWERRIWSWYGSVIVGIALIIWIFVQIRMIGYGNDPPLQTIYGALGVIILALSLARPVRIYLVSSPILAAGNTSQNLPK
jgi:hypothetical protein